MACCADPQPRILEKNGRLFCYNCKRYLDVQAVPDPEPLPATPAPDVVEEDLNDESNAPGPGSEGESR